MIGRSHGAGSAVPILNHAEAEALISARLDAPLANAKGMALAAHLAHCHACSTFAARMSAMQSGFTALPHLPASPTVSRQVRERIAQPSSLTDRIGRLFGGRVGFAPMAATAAMIAILIGGYALLQGDDDGGRQGPTVSAGTQIADDATSTVTAEQATNIVSNATVTQGQILPTEQPTLPTNVRASNETPTETAVPTETELPTAEPTTAPTEPAVPTATHTAEPTATREPTQAPTSTPTDEPTETAEPTDEPTATHTPTEEPTATYTPTDEPTATHTPTDEPTATHTPTDEPTATHTPTEEPAATHTPTDEPTATETETPEPTATEVTGPPTIAPSDDGGNTDEDPPTETAEPEDTTLILPAETPGQGSAGDPTESPTEDSGDDSSETAAPLDDTQRSTGINSGGAPIGPLRINSTQSLMVLSSDASGSDLQVVAVGDGSIVADLGAGGNPIWSPMGLVLLYQQFTGGAPAVAIFDAETGEARSISDPSADGAVQDIPAGWNGTSAYFLRETGDEASTIVLYGYDVNSAEITEVWRSEGVSLSPGRPIASGNGFLIATGQSWLLVGVDGSEVNLGPNDYGLTGEGFLSPFGSLVAYPAGGQIVVAGVDSPGIPVGVIPFVEGPGAGFTWSPDGEQIAVSDGYSIQIYDETGNFIGAATSDNGVTIAAPQWLDDGIYYVETSPTPSLRRLRLSKVPGFSE